MSRSDILPAIVAVTLSALASACAGFEQHATPTTPSETTDLRSYLGEWTSAAATSSPTFPTRETCTSLKWKITSQVGNTVSGQFQATCAGGAELSGVANGTIDGAIKFEASGGATGLGQDLCPFRISGTGTLQTTSTIVMTYSGQTCLGPISGTETLRR